MCVDAVVCVWMLIVGLIVSFVCMWYAHSVHFDTNSEIKLFLYCQTDVIEWVQGDGMSGE